MADVGSAEKPKVFISYSRRDSSEFAEELVTGLELAGFAPFLDRHDIAVGEEWEARLSRLIQQADTVVYVISPEAVKSERCGWEVDRALAQSKRIMPVIFKPVPKSEIPEQLRRRQFVRFDIGPGITKPLTQLANAVRQDIDWIREHTRLAELSGRWEARGRPTSLLLRADDVATTQLWADARKPDAPPITELMRTFIAASKEAETSYLTRSKLAQWRLLALACVFAAVLAAGLAAWWQQEWLKEQLYALPNARTLKTTQEVALEEKDTFKECSDCPEMIVVPSGNFTMGSPNNEKDRNETEGPQHEVTIANPFAISKFELTFDEWDACVTHGDCSPNVGDSGWGRGRRPLANVSWDDAKTYVAWLSQNHWQEISVALRGRIRICGTLPNADRLSVGRRHPTQWYGNGQLQRLRQPVGF